MSAIDQYAYDCLGLIECPVDYRLFSRQTPLQPVHVAIYHLRQTIPQSESDFQGREGDLLVGGGGGEAPAMWIRVPETIRFLTALDRFEQDHPELEADTLIRPYWTPDQAYILGTGYRRLGWNPESIGIADWLTQHVICFVLREYGPVFGRFAGSEALAVDGSICRILTPQEETIWNWKHNR